MSRAIAILTKGAAFLAALLSVPTTAQAADGTALEAAVKATYLYKFEAYVDWPASAFTSPTAPFILCILGNDPFADTVERAVSGQHIGSRGFTVRRLTSIAGDAGCHVLYLSGAGTQTATDALATVRGTPVLTVTDKAAGGTDRGIIDFVIDDNRVRFQINSAAASANGVTISSELLKLALSVKP